jgi:L,D-transpeptidase catalytic domain
MIRSAILALMACCVVVGSLTAPATAAAPGAVESRSATPVSSAAAPDPARPPTPAAAAQPAARNTSGAAAVSENPLEPAGPVHPNRTPGVIALLQTKDDSAHQPHSWSVKIYKVRHRLEVYYKGKFYRSYRAVFGRNLDTSAKLFAGDRRTPEGNYLIIGKYPNRRWRWFLKLNYPNLDDLSRYAELRAAHEIPVFAGHEVSPGNAIGIHGTDVPMLNDGNINWTTGCISVDNGAVDELAALLPIGTLVVIKP